MTLHAGGKPKLMGIYSKTINRLMFLTRVGDKATFEKEVGRLSFSQWVALSRYGLPSQWYYV